MTNYDRQLLRFDIYDEIVLENSNFVNRAHSSIMGNRAKRFAQYYDQCRLPKWLIGVGIGLLVLGLLGAIIIAVFHDKYFSIFGVWDFARTHIWFMVFLALTGVGALISLGYPLLTAIGAGIWVLFSKPESEVIEEQPAEKTPVTKEKASAIEKKAPLTEQSKRVFINEAKLRDIFDSPFMHEWVSDGKNYLDQVIEDLQFVRDNYAKGSKQDEAHFASKHVIEIASILHIDKHFRRIYNSFTDWCCTLFECMYLEPPKRENIKKPQEISNQVKKRFYYLLSKEK